MINRHEFQKFAKQFRSGRISLSEFTAAMFPDNDKEISEESFDNEMIHLRMPVRPSNSHKGDFGRVLFIGGSAEMPGAIALSGLAALRMGTGLATVITPREARNIVASYSPCGPFLSGVLYTNTRWRLPVSLDLKTISRSGFTSGILY